MMKKVVTTIQENLPFMQVSTVNFSGDDLLASLNKLNYQDVYQKLKESIDSNEKIENEVDIYFTLGCILEFNLTKDRTIPVNKLPNKIREYYQKAIDANCIEAKARKCYFEEKQNNDIKEEYKKLISDYNNAKNKLDVNNLKILGVNAAFALFRLGRMYEKKKLGDENSLEEALSKYHESLNLYKMYDINNLDKARVLSRMGWIESTKFAKKSIKYETKDEFDRDICDIIQYFEQAQKLGLRKAKLGILNLNVLQHKLIKGNFSFEYLKTEINKALEIFPHHIKTLMNKADVELIAPSDSTNTIALNVIRKLLSLDPNNSEGKELLSKIIKEHATSFGHALSNRIYEEIEHIVNIPNKHTTFAMKHQRNLIKSTFYKKSKIPFLKMEFLEEQVIWLSSVVIKVLQESNEFKNQYLPINKQTIVGKLASELLKTKNLQLIRKIIEEHKNDSKSNTMQKRRYATFAADIERLLKEENIIPSELVMTKEEYELIDAQSRFKALVYEKFRLGRNAIEVIANEKALPLPDKIDNIKSILDRSLMVMNIPPLCYIGNLLGGNALNYLMIALGTNKLCEIYKQSVINANEEVDEMLPRGNESLDLIQEVSTELAKKYGTQLANIKDNKSLEFLANAAVERMMNHVFSYTGIIQKIKKEVNIRELFNKIMDNDPEPIDPKKILHEGIYKGCSNNEKRFLHTKVVQGRYGKDWVSDGILGKAGIILEDGRIYGIPRNVAKYGCTIGTEEDVQSRSLSFIDQNKLAEETGLTKEIINKIKKGYEKQVKVQDKLAKIEKLDDNKRNMEKTKNIEDSNSESIVPFLPEMIKGPTASYVELVTRNKNTVEIIRF